VANDVVTEPGDAALGDRDQAPPLPPVRRSPGMKPALVVLAVALVVVLGFGLTAAFHGPSKTTPRSAAPTKVPGTPLLAVPAADMLKPIERPGSPPANIVNALTVPKGTVATNHGSGGTSTTGYDDTIDLRVPGATQAAVVAFYKAELNTDGWKRISVGPATNQPNVTQVLAQAAGDDGWYWEIGALVSPTVFGNGTTQATPFTIRLFQVPDAT